MLENVERFGENPVREYGVNQGWCYVTTDKSQGIAPVVSGWRFPPQTYFPENPCLAELFRLSQSWNFTEASLGIAALAAAYPLQEGNLLSPAGLKKEIMKLCRNKSVILAEHFPVLERLLASVCDLKILSALEPAEGDYPWYLAPYLMPEADILIIPDKCLALKTADRYLELGREIGVMTIFAGTAVPGFPVFKELGADICMRFLPDKEKDWQQKIRFGIPVNPLPSYEQASHPSRLPKEMDILSKCPVAWQSRE